MKTTRVCIQFLRIIYNHTNQNIKSPYVRCHGPEFHGEWHLVSTRSYRLHEANHFLNSLLSQQWTKSSLCWHFSMRGVPTEVTQWQRERKVRCFKHDAHKNVPSNTAAREANCTGGYLQLPSDNCVARCLVPEGHWQQCKRDDEEKLHHDQSKVCAYRAQHKDQAHHRHKDHPCREGSVIRCSVCDFDSRRRCGFVVSHSSKPWNHGGSIGHPKAA